MTDVHDMAGRDGLGPLVPDDDGVVFHQAWEGRVLALARAAMAGGHFNLDEFRHAMERIEPGYYMSSSYYERWLEGTITLLLEKGVLGEAEFAARLSELRGLAGKAGQNGGDSP